MANGGLKITRGDILLFYCYELAHAVRVDTLEKLLSRRETAGVLSLRRSKSHYLRFESYPLLVRLGEEKVELSGKTMQVTIHARVFDFGVMSMCLKIPFSGTFEELAAASTAIAESDIFPAIASEHAKKLKTIVSPSLYRPIESNLVEDYAIFRISELDSPMSGQELLSEYGREIAMTLRSEERELSAQEIANALSNSISYYPDDVLVVDWDRAFLYDREEHADHIDIIEFANTQLLDMRYYDRWLDGELDALYRELQAERFRTPILRVARHRHLSGRTMLLMTDVLWLIDQIDNSLKAIDTLYAARVHRAIGRRLYLDEWKRGLDRKLAALRDISNTLNARIYNLRSTLLELSIVILIVVEIVLLLVLAPMP